jgi:flagellar biosynthesis/type III secretory pathway M-ring protein FliF/YscJ
MKQELAKLLENNINNRLTPELANGMFVAIMAIFNQTENQTKVSEDVQPSDTDNG